MASFKYIAIIVVLSALLAICFGQKEQGGPDVSQGGPHQSQGGPNQSQGGPNQSQGGPNQSQGGPNQSQGGPHESQGRTRRQVSQDENPESVNEFLNPQNWTSCDMLVSPKISCYNCNTRMICKPIGGLLKACANPNRPHCNLGICTYVPNPACV